jgi:hypothetical protein
MNASFLERAQTLAAQGNLLARASVALPLACAAGSVSADVITSQDLILETSYVGYWQPSGFFTEVAFTDNESGDYIPLGQVPDGSTVGGATLGNGLKLFGQSTMSDDFLGNVGDDIFDNRGNQAFGVAFVWAGSVARPLAEGDRLSLGYTFDIGVTDNQGLGQSSVFWELRAGIFEQCCDPYVGEVFSFPPAYDTIASGEVLGGQQLTISGIAETWELFSVDPEASYGWAILLTTYWNDPDAFDGIPQFGSASGDTLSVTIPMDSIDVGVNAIPGTAPVPVPAAAWLFGAGLAALGGVVRRRSL